MSCPKRLHPLVAASALLLLPDMARGDEPTAPAPTQIETPLGTVTVAPQPGQTVEDALDAAIQTWGEQNVPRWIGQLSSTEFRERQRAADSLYRVGLAAIPALVDATGSEDTEGALRALAVLTEQWSSRDRRVSDAASEALLGLSESADARIAARVPRSLLEQIGKSRLEALGAKVQLMPPGAAFYVTLGEEWIGGDAGLALLRFLPGDLYVRFGQARVTDAGMTILGKLKRLRELAISAAPITVEGLKELAAHPQLAMLALPPQVVTEEGLQVVGGLPSLFQLDLVNALQWDGDGLQHFAGHPSLTSLNLFTTNAKPEYLVQLLRIPKLTHLQTPQTSMTDEGMEIIGKLAQLSQLQLFNTSVTDAGVVHLRNLKSLEFLNLSGNGITDAALENLREHDKLTSIWLANTFVTRQAAEDLARHLPSLRASSLEGLLETPLSAESLQAVREIQALGGSVTPAFNSTKTCVGLGPEWKGNDADLDKLYVLPNVTQLYIAYPATDSIIPHIEALTTLEHLYLRDTRLTDAALDRLGTSLPKLKIDIINEGS